jgi:hypothetical protein
MNESIPVEAEFTLFRPKTFGLKKRGSNRFRCGLATLGKVFAPAGEVFEICVHNVSHTGIGLDVPHPLKEGQDITVRVRLQNSRTLELPARIIHSTEQVDHSWRIGCAFHEPISNEVLDSLLDEPVS